MATDRRGARRALVEEMGRQLEERAGDEDRIGRLVEDVMAIGDDPDLSSVLQKIVETAAAALNARHCALGVLDEHGHFSDLITTGVDASAVRQAGGTPAARRGDPGPTDP